MLVCRFVVVCVCLQLFVVVAVCGFDFVAVVVVVCGRCCVCRWCALTLLTLPFDTDSIWNLLSDSGSFELCKLPDIKSLDVESWLPHPS